MDISSRVDAWLKTVEIDQSRVPPICDDGADCPAKRRRLDRKGQYATLSPPPSMSNASSSRKRVLPKDSDLPRPDPPKRRSTSPPKKNRSTLWLLKKPIAPSRDPDRAQFAPHIQSLYETILRGTHQQAGIFPHEIRKEIEGRVPAAKLLSTSFREEPTPSALNTYGIAQRVVPLANQAQDLAQSEAGWNSSVHSPLLQALFTELIVLPRFVWGQQALEDELPTDSGAQACLINAMQTSISPEYLPERRVILDEDDRVSVAGRAGLVNTPSVRSGTTQTTQTHGKSDSKKVDYVLALNIVSMRAPMQRAFERVADLAVQAGEPCPQLNQTTYPSLQWTPIACSIETKAAFGPDPFQQLGIWQASWYRRLALLAQDLQLSGEVRPPDVLLVEVAGHDWRMYVMCDQGDVLQPYGPITLGSTRDLIEVYKLLHSLQAIKRWIERDFYKSIADWFGVGTEVPSAEGVRS